MPRPPVSWSWQISFGNVLSFAITATAVVYAWANLSKDVATHQTRIDRSEALIETLRTSSADARSAILDHGRRIAILEATASRNSERLNASDVGRAQLDARLARLDELMTEVRDRLQDLNEQGRAP